jgi:uncharacterized protein (DUF2147 family)
MKRNNNSDSTPSKEEKAALGKCQHDGDITNNDFSSTSSLQFTFSKAGLLIAVLFFLFSLTPLAYCQTGNADDLVGVWDSLDHTFKIEMFKADKDYEAHLLYGNHVVEKDGTFKTDAKNPDPALRSRSLKGIVLIKGLVWNSAQWSGGTLYDGSSGTTYQCKAEIKDGILLLRGFRGTPLFGETIKFQRSP